MKVVWLTVVHRFGDPAWIGATYASRTSAENEALNEAERIARKRILWLEDWDRAPNGSYRRGCVEGTTIQWGAMAVAHEVLP